MNPPSFKFLQSYYWLPKQFLPRTWFGFDSALWNWFHWSCWTVSGLQWIHRFGITFDCQMINCLDCTLARLATACLFVLFWILGLYTCVRLATLSFTSAGIPFLSWFFGVARCVFFVATWCFACSSFSECSLPWRKHGIPPHSNRVSKGSFLRSP